MDFGPFAAVIAFVVFFTVCAVVGMVLDYKKRQLALEPLRLAIERGQALDATIVERLTAPERNAEIDPIHLRIGGIVTVAAGIGVAFLAFFLAHLAPVAFYPVLGGGIVAICVGAGLIVAARALERRVDRSGAREPHA